MEHTNLDDGTADRFLLDAKGTSMLVFHSKTCGACAMARERLPDMQLPADRLCWIDAGDNGGLVERYQVFHLPALFVVRDGEFFGALHTRLTADALNEALAQALGRIAEELP